MLTIVQAHTQEQIAAVRGLINEYTAWVDFPSCLRGLEEELSSLPGKYAPPGGRLLLAFWDGTVAGMGALRPLSDEDACEMKRLYVRPEFRGHNIGRALARRLIADACEIGYRAVRLDTVQEKMDKAIHLYRELGFREMPPYQASGLAQALFMELVLPSFSVALSRAPGA